MNSLDESLEPPNQSFLFGAFKKYVYQSVLRQLHTICAQNWKGPLFWLDANENLTIPVELEQREYNTLVNQTINIGFAKLKEVRYFLCLSHNEKQELFFRVLWGQNRPTYFYDGLDKSEHDIRNIDHISFHEDGTIHLISYDSSNKRDTISHTKLAKPIGQLLPNEYIPLIVFSIYDLEKAKKHVGQSVPLAHRKSGDVQKQKNVDAYWEIEDANRFSLVFFLLGWHSVNVLLDVKSMLQTKFPTVFNIGSVLYIGDYLEREASVLGLAIAYTEKVIPPPEDGLMGTKKSKELKRTEVLYGFNFVASDEKIWQLV